MAILNNNLLTDEFQTTGPLDSKTDLQWLDPQYTTGTPCGLQMMITNPLEGVLVEMYLQECY